MEYKEWHKTVHKYLDSEYFGHYKRQTKIDNGLILLGGTGTGKTTIMDKERLERLETKKPSYLMKTANMLCLEYHPFEANDFLERYAKVPMCIDEFGKESKPEVIRQLLEIRDANNAKTYIIANYDNEEAPEIAFFEEVGIKYGGHIQSRLLGMNLVLVKDKDYRL